MTAQTETVVGFARTGEVAETVVTLVAELKQVDPRELDPPLHEFVDADALDSLFRGVGGEWSGGDGSHVELRAFGCRVRIQDTGRVEVTPARDDEGW